MTEQQQQIATGTRPCLHAGARLAWLATAAALVSASPALSQAAPTDVSLKDLVEMRTIDSLTLSPDGRSVAFRVLAPKIGTNTVEETWYKQALVGAAAPVRIGGVAEPQLMPMSDFPLEQHPLWLESGRGILVARLGDDGLQVHALEPDGRDVTITTADADVERYDVSADSRSLIVVTRASRKAVADAERKEARDGIHFDQTILTDGTSLTRGFLDGRTWTSLRRDEAGGYRPAHGGPPSETTVPLRQDARAAPRPTYRSAAVQFFGDDPTRHRLPWGGGSVGFAEVRDGVQRLSKLYRISFEKDGHEQACTAAVCTGNSYSFRLLAVDSKGVLHVMRQEDGSGWTRLYAIDPGLREARAGSDPRSTLGGGGFEGSCLQSDDDLICVRAGPTSPPSLVAVELRTGAIRPLYDPNADLRARVYPKVRSLDWTDRFGRSSNGVLVLPMSRHGSRIKPTPSPLVIATYRCSGLLRGGVAQVAPEFMLAQRGFAVLCANANPANNELPPENPRDPALKMHKADIEGYGAVIGMLAKQGLVDPKRVGIAGHSYSANVISYAVSHTDLFRAAVVGSGMSIDSASYWVASPAADTWRRENVLALVGLPHPDNDPAGIWAANGPSLNAARVKTAMLFQPPESEFLMLTQFYAALQDHGGSVDMVVYPGAAHMFGRFPQQLLTRAERSIDWFEFWLAGGACGTVAAQHPEWTKFVERAAKGTC